MRDQRCAERHIASSRCCQGRFCTSALKGVYVALPAIRVVEIVHKGSGMVFVILPSTGIIYPYAHMIASLGNAVPIISSLSIQAYSYITQRLAIALKVYAT